MHTLHQLTAVIDYVSILHRSLRFALQNIIISRIYVTKCVKTYQM